LKKRAAANPAAALAIGAGVGWRLARHAPISAILIGLGVVGLMKTSPTSGPSPMVRRAREWADSATELSDTVVEKARNMAEGARELGAQAREAAADTYEQVSTAASGIASRAREAVADASERTSDAAARTYDMASSGMSQASSTEMRDTYLLGAAALAIGAAAFIGYHRRDE
jgi:hypothetical protein